MGNEPYEKSSHKISMVDLIVLTSVYAIESEAKDSGLTVKVPFAAGRNDTTQDVN